MGRPAAFILTENGVFYSKDTNEHSDILKEHNIKSDFVKLEVTPQDYDYRIPIEDWVVSIDALQRGLPCWFDLKDDSPRVKEKLANWAAYHLCHARSVVNHSRGHRCYINSRKITVYDGVVYLIDSEATIWGGDVQIKGKSKVTINNGTAWVHDTSEVIVNGGNVKLYDKAAAVVHKGAVKLYNDAYARVFGGKVITRDNATIDKV